MMQRNLFRTSQSGFTLLELLLVVGITAVLFLGISKITRSWIDAESATGAGQHLQRVSGIVQKYVEAQWDVLPESPDVLASALVPGSQWADLRTILNQEGMLNPAGELRSPFGVPLRISYMIDTSGPTQIYRASVFTTQNLPNKQVLDAARNAGTAGGTITTLPTSPTIANNATGAFGQWQIATTKILPSNAAFPYAYTPARGFLIAVVSFNQDTLCGSFLYRKDMSGTPCTDANKMETSLNMGGNDIANAATVNTVDLNVNDTANLGTTTVNGTATFNGATTAANGMTVNNGMTVSGDSNFSDNVTMANGGTMNVQNLNAKQVQASKIVTNNLNVDDMNAQGNMIVDNNVTVNGDMTVSGSGAEVFASTVNAGQVNASGGQAVFGSMDVQNTMVISGGVTINGSGGNAALSTDHLQADSCVKVGTDPYGPGC